MNIAQEMSTSTIQPHEAKLLHWYEIVPERYLCIRENSLTLNAAFLVRDLDIQYCTLNLTPLPDCTGWDWTPPAPEPKYRPFRDGDEFAPSRDRWVREILSDRTKKISSYVYDRLDVDGKSYGYDEFLIDFVFFDIDGSESPCGVEVTP